MPETSFVVGLGSNRRHHRHGPPRRVVLAAVAAMAEAGIEVRAATAPVTSTALGPAGRRFANAAALVRTPLDPSALLGLLKSIERGFGRRRGRRWGPRVLDLDILAWEAGAWPAAPRAAGRRLAVPHAHLLVRDFALGPAAILAPRWRAGGVSLRAARARLARPRPVDRGAAGA